jgi:large subunit ribosomal protein L9
MLLILRSNIEKLGKVGDEVDVPRGYARNYLLPQGLALKSSKENRRRLEAEKKRLLEAEDRHKADLADVAKKLETHSYTISMQASEEGHLFGSVTAIIVADALKKEDLPIEPKMVLLDAPIKELGIYEIQVRLHPDIQVPTKVWIVKEGNEPM